MTLHQRGISALDPQAAFREGTSIGRVKMSAVLFRLHENKCRNFEVLLTSQSLNFFFCTSPYEVDYGYELWDFRAL